METSDRCACPRACRARALFDSIVEVCHHPHASISEFHLPDHPLQVEVEADWNFEMSPLAASLCIPLQLRVAESGHPDHVPTVESSLNRMVVLRLMTEPGIGLPMTWQSLAAGTLPSVIVTRADGVPVTPAEWRVIGEYLKYADEELDEEETRRPSVFRDFVCGLLHGTEEMEDPILHPPVRPAQACDPMPTLP